MQLEYKFVSTLYVRKISHFIHAYVRSKKKKKRNHSSGEEKKIVVHARELLRNIFPALF